MHRKPSPTEELLALKVLYGDITVYGANKRLGRKNAGSTGNRILSIIVDLIRRGRLKVITN